MATDAEIELSDLLEANPSALTFNFSELISNKKEFAELASDTNDKLPAGKFKFFKHQEFVHRFMRNYDDLLDISETGTGKSGSSIGFFEKCRIEFEKIKSDPANVDKKMAHFKRVIILVNGPTQKAEFRKQLLKTAADNFFEKPVNIKEGTSSEQAAKAEKANISRRIKDAGYIIKTYGKFAREIRGTQGKQQEGDQQVVKKRSLRSYPIYNIDRKVLSKEEADLLEKQNEKSTRELIEDYSDSIFWIDEAHNLNMEPDKLGTYKEKIETYRTIQWVFHTVLRSKRIISTATPMLNADVEIVFLLNLLLPRDGILPTGYDYRNAPRRDIETFFPGFPFSKVAKATPKEIGEYFRGQIYVKLRKEIRESHKELGGTKLDGNNQERKAMDIKNVTYDEMEPYLRGKIFYIRAAETGATPVEKGITTVVESNYNKQTYTSIVTTENSIMSPYQDAAYRQLAVKGNIKNKNADDIYTAVRQVSNFAFPSTTISSGQKIRSIDLFNAEDIEEIAETVEDVEEIDMETMGNFKHFIKAKGDRFVIDEEFIDEITVNMQKYSCKYNKATYITETSPGLGYCYGTYVEGSGAIVLAACYKVRGYERFDENSSVFGPDGKIRIKPGKRYGLITGSISDARLAAMLELASSPQNLFGEYIKELILSRTGRDGININNVTRYQAIGSEWNGSANYQAKSRGIRVTSHDVLLAEYQRIINELTDACDQTLMTEEFVNKAIDLITALSGGLKTEWDGTVTNYNIYRFIQNLELARSMSTYNDLFSKVEVILRRENAADIDFMLANGNITNEEYYLLDDFTKQKRSWDNAGKLVDLLTGNLSRSIPNGAKGEQLEEILKYIPRKEISLAEKRVNNSNAINTIFFEKSSLYKTAIEEWQDDPASIIESLRIIMENCLRLIKDLTTRLLTPVMVKEAETLKQNLLKKVKDVYVKSDPPVAALEISIYQHAAIPLSQMDEKDHGVDIMMYKIVEEKSHHIKRIMGFLKRSSVGYEVFKNRNIRPLDEEQYEGEIVDPSTLDYSTYDIVYSRDMVKNFEREIEDIFRDHMSVTFKELLDLLVKYQLEYVANKLTDLRSIREIGQLLPIYQNDFIINNIKKTGKKSYYEEKYLTKVLEKLQSNNIDPNEVTQTQLDRLFPLYRNQALLAVLGELKDLRDIKNQRKLSELIPSYREKYVVMALENIITHKIPLIDKFGHTVYLRENDGYFYLTRTYPIGTDSTYSMLYYTENIIAVKHNAINDITGVQNANLGNEILLEIKNNYHDDQEKINEYLDEIPIEAQEKVLEDVMITALTMDNDYFTVPVALKRKKNYIDYIIEKYADFIIWMHEPIDDIAKRFREQANPKVGPGRKRDPNKIAKDKRYHANDFNEIALKMEENEENEMVYLHTLNSKAGGRTVYNATSKIIKGEGRVPVLKISELQKGWRNLEGVEKDAYRPYIQKIMSDRQNEFVKSISDYQEYQIYGSMIAGQFRVIDEGTETDKGKSGKLSSKNRGRACGGPSGKTVPKPKCIDWLWRIRAPPPKTTLKTVTDDNREEIIDKLLAGSGHSTLKDPNGIRITDREILEQWSNEKINHYYQWIYSGRTTQQMADAIFERLDSIGAVKYE